MVLQNWISFLKKQKGLFAILMVSQIVSLVCNLLVFFKIICMNNQQM